MLKLHGEQMESQKISRNNTCVISMVLKEIAIISHNVGRCQKKKIYSQSTDYTKNNVSFSLKTNFTQKIIYKYLQRNSK